MDSEANDKSEQALKRAVESMAYSDERLRTEMYDAVERVIVYDNSEIEIEWRCANNGFVYPAKKEPG